MRGRLLSGALTVVVAAVAGASPSVAMGNQDARVMSVSGAGAGTLGPEWGPYDGDPVRFEIEGTATDPLHPSGTFHVVHRKPDGRLLAEFSGRITSLAAVDEVAVVTGVIEVADHPGVPQEMVGKPVSLTVYDGGRQDRIGWMWGFFGAPVEPLQGTAPDLPLTDSAFTVRDGGRSQATPGVALTAAGDGTTVGALVGDRSVRLELAARVPAGGTAKDVRGGFHFAESGVDVSGRIDCLVAGGPVAIATGVVTRSNDPAKMGKPVSFSLKDGKVDRIGWLWSWSEQHPSIVDCRSTVPFYAPRAGSVVVRS